MAQRREAVPYGLGTDGCMWRKEEGRAEAESLAESIWSFWATGNGGRP